MQIRADPNPKHWVETIRKYKPEIAQIQKDKDGSAIRGQKIAGLDSLSSGFLQFFFVNVEKAWLDGSPTGLSSKKRGK